MLVKASSAEEAESNMDEFLEYYGEGKVWDWNEIGGRWSGVLGGGDIVPLASCIEIVKEWRRDMEKVIVEAWDKMVENKEKDPGLSALYAGYYKDAVYNEFCFENNVFNVTEGAGENIPEDTTGWWAIMLDIHN